ncbi:hypothetical protein BLL52_3852 [Rhodoferax antarcticus ANT.BR]|uniref:Uncharacterized protein n=1 Tax=Rhodoferax antarcticus ANT.BR TaxID=1111071 RepID=A0A1Q8YAM1_9BURK|nr:hypothetical protein BLL52_3852 [Rhodoferax antarcticus ANT.BR]
MALDAAAADVAPFSAGTATTALAAAAKSDSGALPSSSARPAADVADREKCMKTPLFLYAKLASSPL